MIVHGPGPVVRRVGRLVFLFSLCLYATTTGGSMATDIMTYEVTKNIVEHRSVAMSYNLYQMDAHRGVDGRHYAPYGIGHAIYSIPFYLAGRATERVTGLDVGKAEVLRKAAVAGGSTVAAAASVWFAFWFAWRIAKSLHAALAVALSFGFATLLWPYSKFGFNAPLASLCVVGGVYGCWLGVRERQPAALVAGGVGLGCALLVRHELALVTLPVGLWFLLESRPRWDLFVRRSLFAGAPVVAAVLITAYYNVTRFGNPLDTGYLRDETAGFGSAWEGFLGLLVSPGGSLFVYSPVLIVGAVALVGLYRSDRNTATLFGSVVLTMFAFYALLQHWDADRSYGARYLLPAHVFLCIPLGIWFRESRDQRRHRIAMAACLVSAIVQLPGVLVDFSKVGSTPETARRTLQERRWDLSSTALVVNTRASLELVPRNVGYLAGAVERPPPKAAEGLGREFSHQFADSLDFWWIYLFHVGAVPAAVALMLGAVPGGLAAWCVIKLRRRLAT